ncbi:MAG: hypothetical protein LBD64_05015, partial [Odoribacteraceae bacterium]|nr:hypothetical protein [Odoribacteraceae bacterium]
IGGKTFLPNPYESFYLGHIPSPTGNLPAELARRWKNAGDASGIPGLYTNRNVPITLEDPSTGSTNTEDRYRMWAHSDARVASTSTLKCKMVQLAWNGKPRLLENSGVRSVSVNASVNNLFLVAGRKWKGMDPALGGTRVEPRAVNIGINIGF